MRDRRLPVDPERLQLAFPALTPEDIAAYVEVTRRIMGAAPDARAGVTREAVTGARRAREKAARGEALDTAEALLLRYLGAMEKMQPKTPPGA